MPLDQESEAKLQQLFMDKAREFFLETGNLKQTKEKMNDWLAKIKKIQTRGIPQAFAEVGIDFKINQNQYMPYVNDAYSKIQQLGIEKLKKLGTPVLTSGEDQHAEVPRHYRALDAAARLIMKEFPKEKCVAVCVEPRYEMELLVASNAGRLQAAEVREALEMIDGTQQGELPHREVFRPISAMRMTGGADGRQKYTQLRESMDVIKSQKAAHKLLDSYSIRVVSTAETMVHAELQLLSHVEQDMRGAGARPELYIGVSLLCCGKCKTVIDMYNHCGVNQLRVKTRGWHPTYDFGNWRCPESLVELISETHPDFKEIALELQLAKQDANSAYPMTVELSEDEGEYMLSEDEDE